jgi:thiol-disulfide isomerase/thioredoxin
MNAENEPAPVTQSGGGRSFTIVLLIVGIAAILMAAFLGGRSNSSRITEPSPAPEIRVEGWLNGPGPTAEELRGQVIVLDAWAFWCGPCRASAPELVKLHEKYRDRGVLFLGLTAERDNVRDRNVRFLEDTKITWPNGYGAVETLMELRADYIPQRWVIDRNYQLIWDESSSESIDGAIDRALAQTP